MAIPGINVIVAIRRRTHEKVQYFISTMKV